MRFAGQLATALTLLGTAAAALSHDGHGLAQPQHWHATDTAGFAFVAVLAALALWSGRDK
jgi:hypothetical protein